MTGKKAKEKTRVPPSMQPWIEARQRFRLSDAHVQMARELGLNPQKLGKLANHDREPWKLPLPDFIAKLYRKNFGRERPETVRSIEEMAAAKQAKKQAKKAARAVQITEGGAGEERVQPDACTAPAAGFVQQANRLAAPAAFEA